MGQPEHKDNKDACSFAHLPAGPFPQPATPEDRELPCECDTLAHHILVSVVWAIPKPGAQTPPPTPTLASVVVKLTVLSTRLLVEFGAFCVVFLIVLKKLQWRKKIPDQA